MRLQAYAVQWDAGLPEPFQKFEEVVASIVFDPQIILEAELVDHQLRPWRQLTCLPQGPRNVVSSERLEENAVSQAIHSIARLDGLVDDIPSVNFMAVAGECGFKVSLNNPPTIFLEQQCCGPIRHAFLPNEGVPPQ